jgi:hypothetical protein
MKTTWDGARAPSVQLGSLERERRKEREAPDEQWALAVMNTLMAELPKLTEPPPQPGASLGPSAVGDSQAPAGHAPELDEAGEAAGAERGGGAGGSRGSPELVSSLSAEVSDERLGRLQLCVERVDGRLDIVINVADTRVKALIEAEQSQLVKTLKDAGLRVASVQIGAPSRPGTALAQERGGAEKARASASFRQPAARWRTHTGSAAAEEDADGEGVDLTA